MSKLIDSILDGDFESVVESVTELMDFKTDDAVLDLAEGYDSINEELSLGANDHKVLAAFAKGEKAESKKLSTDGKTLHGNWMGGGSIAKHIDGKVHLRQMTSRSEQTVHRALKKKHLAKNDIAECVDTEFDESTQQIEEGRRIVSTHEYRNHSAKVYKNSETGEHEVEFYKDGKHLKDATYHTDDKADAQGTAKHFISKATVSEDFQLDELSQETLKSYINKNVEDGYVVARQKGVAKAALRTQGLSHKPGSVGLHKIYKTDEKKKITEGEEQLDELSKETLSNYIKGASVDMGEYIGMAAKRRKNAEKETSQVGKDHNHAIANAYSKKADSRLNNIKKAATKLAEEAINELSKNTLASYIKGASNSAAGFAGMSAMRDAKAAVATSDAAKKRHTDIADEYAERSYKRLQGIKKAASKLAEETEEIGYGDLMELSEGIYVKADEASKMGDAASAPREPYMNFEKVDEKGNYAGNNGTHFSHGIRVFKFANKKAYEYAKKLDRPLSEMGEHEFHAVVHNHESEPKYFVNGKEVSKPSEHHEYIKNRLKI
jgi:hypothetical protein